MPKSTPLLQGTLELIVLQLLRAEPTNGYDLTLRIQAISRDVLQVNAGSLYPALYRLEERALIKAEWDILAGAVHRQTAMQRQLLLTRELRHRVGNLLTLVLSLFNNTARRASSVEEGLQHLAHDL